MPQFLFVGDPSFWYRTAEAAYANVRDLITAWVDLEPLTSAESREFVALLLESAGPAAGSALDKAVLDGLVHASDGLIGRLVSLLAVAAAPDEAVREHVADPCPDCATAVASGESDNVSDSENDAGWLPKGAVPMAHQADPDAAADPIGAPRTADRGSVRSHRVPALVSLAGAVMLAGMVGAVAYRRISVPAELGARAESTMTIEASSDSAHPAPPDAAAGARSEPGSAIVQAAQAATDGGLGPDMAPTAAAVFTPDAAPPPVQPALVVSGPLAKAPSPGVGLASEARLTTLSMVFSPNVVTGPDNAAANENPQARATSPSFTPPTFPPLRPAAEAPAATPALPATASAGPSAFDAMNAAATIVPALAQPESPLPATVLPSQSGTADTDAPAVPAIARPADSSSSSETEAQTSVAQPPTTASAAADTLNAGATDAAHPGGTPSPEASPPESAVPLPVVSPAATPSEAAGAAGTEARASGTTVEPSASAAQSEPPPSDTSPRADTVEVTGGAGTDARRGAATVEPSAAAAQSAPAPSDTPSPAAELEAAGAAVTDARTGATTVEGSAPAAQSGPAPSGSPPPAVPSEPMKSDAASSDTAPTVARAQPSASVPTPTEVASPAPPTPMPAVPVSRAAAVEAPTTPAAVILPSATRPATQTQAVVVAVPTAATPSKAPSVTTASSRFPPPDLGPLLSRGDAMLALGDISAARLLYERAASLGSAKAATALGKTYDPVFLASIQVSGLAPNRTAAATWYRKGAELGDAEAADRLAGLTAAQ